MGFLSVLTWAKRSISSSVIVRERDARNPMAGSGARSLEGLLIVFVPWKLTQSLFSSQQKDQHSCRNCSHWHVELLPSIVHCFAPAHVDNFASICQEMRQCNSIYMHITFRGAICQETGRLVLRSMRINRIERELYGCKTIKLSLYCGAIVLQLALSC